MSDFFSDYDNDSAVASTTAQQDDNQQGQGGRQGGGFAEEIVSKKIRARSRTYFVDLKQSMYGKFVKISEKSNGRKSTIMIDAENIDDFIEALQEMKSA